jgi:peptidoglycan/xylan/chitin deacetylase (PgdA/CDA1 family)
LAAAGAAAAAGLAGWAAEPEPGVPVLAYHRFDPADVGPTTIRVATFNAQLDWFAGHGRAIVGLREALAGLGARGAGGPPRAVITADDGHVSVFTELFPLIVRRALPVTLFIIPSVVSREDDVLTWDQLRRMRDTGLVDIEAHTFTHPNFRVERRRRGAADYRAFVDAELGRSRELLEAKLHKAVDLMAWPYGIVDADLEAAARRAGYLAAFAYAGGPMIAGDDRLSLPRVRTSDADRGALLDTLVTRRTPIVDDDPTRRPPHDLPARTR